MKFSLNWIKDYFSFKESGQAVADLFNLKSFEVSEVKKVGEDEVLNLDILPNRFSDAASHFGLARELSALLARPLKINLFQPKNYKFPELVGGQTKRATDFLKIKIENKKACPIYSARVIFDVKVGPSPDFMQKRLLRLGLKPINNVVDATNYAMLELGQPLHAFDYDKLAGSKNRKQIKVRFAKANEIFKPIDSPPQKLTRGDLVIADSQKPIALAGIKGGENTMIDENTQRIVIESANFSRETIYLTSKRTNLVTDASIRFGAGLDPTLAQIALERAGYLIWRYAQGKVLRGQVVGAKLSQIYQKILVNPDSIRKLLGINIPDKEIKKILLRVGCSITPLKNDFLVMPAINRLDLNSWQDLAEEVIRVYGFNKIKGTLPLLSGVPSQENEIDEFQEKIRDWLKSFAFSETYNYSFIAKGLAEYFKNYLRNLLEIENPPSLNFKYFRPSLVFGLMIDLKTNQKHQEQIKIFEIGNTAVIENQKPKETLKLGAAVCQDASTQELFRQAKGYLSMIFEAWGLADVLFEDLLIAPFDFDNGASILIDDEEIGWLAALGRKTKEFFDLEKNAVIFEIDLVKLFGHVEEEIEYQPLPKFPAVIYDISFLIDKRLKISEVLSIMQNSGAKYVEDIHLFDTYTAAEAERQSLAFRIVFRSNERTLSEAEAKKEFEKIKKTLELKAGATIR